MSSNLAINTVTGNTADKISNLQVIEGNKDKGLSSLKEGQQITGTVVAVGDQITLDFDGQEVTTSKSVLSNAKPGDVKKFEVVKATDNEIELKVLDESSSKPSKTFKAVKINKGDWDSILAKKEQTAKKTEQEAEYKETKTKLEQINSKLTELDCKRLEDEGFQIEDYTISGLFAALNRIKISNSNTGTEVKVYEKRTSFDKTALTNRLKEENLPVTDENLAHLSKALEISGSVAKMDDKSIQYLISTETEPSVENIYKSQYSTTSQGNENRAPLTEKAWKELENQVKEVIKAAGYEVNGENLSDAKWLIENKLPLTTETFTYKKNINTIKNEDKNDILNTMLVGMKKGIDPKDVSLMPTNNTAFEKVIADVKAISDEAIAQAVKEDNILTINRLATIQESLATSSSKDSYIDTTGEAVAVSEAIKSSENTNSSETTATGTKDYQFEELKAKRQLEEIRLKMTLQAAAQLEKKGISVETEELSKVVVELRKLEDNYYKDVLKEADAEATELSVQTLKDTTQSIEKLNYMPCSVLGSTLTQRNNQTITGLLTEGSKLQAEYAKAGTAYETLATVPNSEYGDSIKKAFANADSLLKQMNLDTTEQNKRAVRILGYNQMDITEDSINQVKMYDLQVTTLIQNLHPAVTVRMIKEGVNPLEMPIGELNRTIDQRKEEQGITSEDKFSTYLRGLEKQEGITSEERKAYIGVYRLLYNIDKSDGAAVGAVVKADREITLGNLLTAIQTSNKGRINEKIDEEFGTLQSISYKKETIAEQLNTFINQEGQQKDGQFNNKGLQEANQSSEKTSMEEQTEYLDRILKQIKEELSPGKLMQAADELTVDQSQTLKVTTDLSTDGIWDKVKNTPIEKLLEQLRNTDHAQAAEEEAYTNKVQEIRELSRNSEQSIRFLNDYKVPSTPLNIMMANSLLSNGESTIKKLLKPKNENQVENSENSLKEINDLSDTLIDKSSMQDAYEQLEANAKAVLSQACSEETIDSRRLAELKSMGQQMTFIRALADKEFYQIPIETDKGITNMNLTILRGTDTAGKVSVNVWSEQLGNIKAEFSLKEQSLKGFFSSDDSKGLEQLQKNAGEIENVAQENNITIKQMDFGVLRKETDNYRYQNLRNDAKSTTVTGNTERNLYRIAKAIVHTVRMAENSDID